MIESKNDQAETSVITAFKGLDKNFQCRGFAYEVGKTYEHKGKQFMGVFSGIGGWAGIGMAAGLTESTEGLGAVGGYKDLAKYTTLGGSLFIFGLPDSTSSATTALQ